MEAPTKRPGFIASALDDNTSTLSTTSTYQVQLPAKHIVWLHCYSVASHGSMISVADHLRLHSNSSTMDLEGLQPKLARWIEKGRIEFKEQALIIQQRYDYDKYLYGNQIVPPETKNAYAQYLYDYAFFQRLPKLRTYIHTMALTRLIDWAIPTYETAIARFERRYRRIMYRNLEWPLYGEKPRSYYFQAPPYDKDDLPFLREEEWRQFSEVRDACVPQSQLYETGTAEIGLLDEVYAMLRHLFVRKDVVWEEDEGQPGTKRRADDEAESGDH
jgi:hypothetical protein